MAVSFHSLLLSFYSELVTVGSFFRWNCVFRPIEKLLRLCVFHSTFLLLLRFQQSTSAIYKIKYSVFRYCVSSLFLARSLQVHILLRRVSTNVFFLFIQPLVCVPLACCVLFSFFALFSPQIYLALHRFPKQKKTRWTKADKKLLYIKHGFISKWNVCMCECCALTRSLSACACMNAWWTVLK